MASLTSDDSVGDLRAVVCSMLNIENFERVNLKTLQPTRIIEMSEDSKPLSEIFRQTREKFVVEQVRLLPPDQVQPATSDQSLSTQHGAKPVLKHRKSDTDENDPLQESNEHLVHSQHSFAQSANVAASASTASDDSPLRTRKLPREQADQIPVCSSTGYLLRHPVPSNNSCLFISVHFCLTNGVVDDQIGKSMRKIIADTVASDKERFTDAVLGKSNADYCKWILDDNNWGGAIELSILCKYYQTEIVAIDTKNTILNRFGEDSHYPQRMLLIYDGLHYDPLKFQPIDENRPVQTLFPSDNIEVLSLAEEVAKELKQSHQFTDLKAIQMMCSTCESTFDAKNAHEHATRTGHTNFKEIL